jgi:hypothetical protein
MDNPLRSVFDEDGAIVADWFQGDDGSPTLMRITDECWIDPFRIMAVTKCEHPECGPMVSTHIMFRDGFMVSCSMPPAKVVDRIATVLGPVA